NHNHPFDLYFKQIIGPHFGYWFVLFVIGLFLGFTHKLKFIRELSLFSLLCALVFFFIISSSQTKLFWYDAPLYPFMAIVAAIPFWRLSAYLLEKYKLKK